MVSVIWYRTTQIAREETNWRHYMGCSFRLAARVLLYAPSHTQNSTYNGLCYTSCGALAWTTAKWRILATEFMLEGSKRIGRVSIHGEMGHQVHPSCWTQRVISYFSHCSTTGITKARVCTVLSKWALTIFLGSPSPLPN